MKEKYTFDHDERIDYALDCQEILYDYLRKNMKFFADRCDPQLLEYKLQSETLAIDDVELALKCIERKTS